MVFLLYHNFPIILNLPYKKTFIGKILIVILAANPPATITAIATQVFTGLAVLFPTVIAALYGKDISPLSCIISIIFG